MKNLILIILTLCWFLPLLTTASAQIDTVNVDLSDRTVDPGEAFVVFLYVVSEPPPAGAANELLSAKVQVSWDVSALAYDYIEFGRAVPEGWTMDSLTVDLDNGIIYVEMSGTRPIIMEAGILKYHFIAIGSPEDTTWVRFEAITFNEGDPAVTTDDARIIFTSYHVDLDLSDRTIDQQQKFVVFLYIVSEPPPAGSTNELLAATAKVSYDITALEYDFVEFGRAVPAGWTMDSLAVDLDNGTIYVEMSGTQPIVMQAGILKYHFIAIGAPGDTNWVRFEQMQFNNGFPLVATNDALIIIKPLPQSTLTMAVAPAAGGTTNPTPGNHDYDTGTVLTISAIPSAGYQFISWTGEVADDSSATTTVTMDTSKTVTANFVPVSYTLTMTVEPAAGGTTTPELGSHHFNAGTPVNITAIPAAGYQFVCWTGEVADDSSATTTVTMDTSKTVTANFVLVSYTLTMTVEPAAGGTTTPELGSHHFNAGTPVNITAIPAAGYQFVCWTGEVADDSSATTTVTMDTSKTVTANFQPITYSLILMVEPLAAGTTIPEIGRHVYNAGTMVTIHVQPAIGYKFSHWNDDVNDTTSSKTIIMDSTRSLIAHFITITGVENMQKVANFALYQNYPNPFNPRTLITYDLKNNEPQRTTLIIYNLEGHVINTLVDRMAAGGRYQVLWDGTDARGIQVSSGTYFYVIKSGSFTNIKKMIKLK